MSAFVISHRKFIFSDSRRNAPTVVRYQTGWKTAFLTTADWETTV